jgi:hypothetical protein
LPGPGEIHGSQNWKTFPRKPLQNRPFGVEYGKITAHRCHPDKKAVPLYRLSIGAQPVTVARGADLPPPADNCDKRRQLNPPGRSLAKPHMSATVKNYLVTALVVLVTIAAARAVKSYLPAAIQDYLP